MIKSFKELRDIKLVKPAVLAVAAAEDDVDIEAVLMARASGLVIPVLYGDEAKIQALLGDVRDIQIVGTKSPEESCHLACQAVNEDKADMILKGLVETKILLKEVLNKEFDLKRSPVLSHVMLYDLAKYPKLLSNTDGGMVQSPTLEQKAEIIKNAVKVHHALGIPMPKVACVCAVEKVNEKMPCTLDARELQAMNQRGEITGCHVQGPLAFDLAISPEAAAHKGVTGEVAGDADDHPGAGYRSRQYIGQISDLLCRLHQCRHRHGAMSGPLGSRRFRRSQTLLHPPGRPGVRGAGRVTGKFSDGPLTDQPYVSAKLLVRRTAAVAAVRFGMS